MFGRKETIGKVETIISDGTEVKGDISSEGTIRIDGLVDGHILKSSGVIIGQTGRLTGDVQAESIAIGGEVAGNVIASNNLELLSTAKVCGDIKTQTLSIQEGAVFEGKCKMRAVKDNKEHTEKHSKQES
ncbi:MAG: polymer-forming cytoskeletal protein [Elusimicrobia bacterium]|nr:polymer-forming cytoskeletal protein [Elusimicrobiota bacterium]